MSMSAILERVNALAEQLQWLGLLPELLARSSLILALALALTCLAARLPAALRHLIWHGCILSLLLLPLFMTQLPALEISIASAAPEGSAQGAAGQGAELAAPAFASLAHQLLLAYLTIAAGLLLYGALGIFRVHLLTAGSQAMSGTARELLDALLREEGVLRRVSLRGCSELAAPASWGLFRPVILLPPAAARWPESKLKHVLLHELAHIRRLDWLSQLLSRIACALYWFNPLVWFAARKLAQEAECACDDAVLLQGSVHCDYASDLLDIARQIERRRRAKLSAQALADSFLGTRVAAILGAEVRRNSSEALYLIRSLLVCLPLLAVIASVELVPAFPLAPMNQALGRLISIELIPGSPDPHADSGLAARPPMEPVRLLPEAGGLADTRLPPLDAGADPQPGAATLRMEHPPVPPVSLDVEVLAPTAAADPVAEGVHPLVTVLPDYPAFAREKGIEGYAVVEYAIDEQGKVTDARVVDALPKRVFDRSSLAAVQRQVFAPPRLNGEAVSVRGLRTRFSYRLGTGDGN